ncbi:hypothetical protein ABZ135_23160 [Streptomyces sp. NPDC006339]|uniref:hypothetical protein n=1 Tax=Streptomyces sp. NPDC006339 TaxID=3156755 RepID=UPI00339EE460
MRARPHPNKGSVDGARTGAVRTTVESLAALRPIADRYIELSTQTLTRYTDPITATTTAAVAMNGFTLRGLAGAHTPRRTDIENTLRRILNPH